ncbi:SDR family NAD(P)-dependent oxidoreductase [Amycolatopsis alkalitolerans]|uniref:SDR family NAD(P)-dependent oxidoreductase n=1 Tax=Amycolatopsis alkalitolerans TaxID=2547244 RepID=A0A5C4M742_9PSEU|nr:SDR family NAD(P)-dependent oxidoreductase [Amycolatopsis alkalitolerans]TNC29166.1 SDR family NAD(P)-dependent oxidoreductase [Amycolatopsis alkalitolerans]
MVSQTGQVALVTGAASGIGQALSSELCRRGHTVILADNDSARLARVTGQLAGFAGTAVAA